MLLKMRQDAESVPESGPEADAFWTEISSKWFTLFPTTRPYVLRGFEQIADNVNPPVASVIFLWRDLLS
jgi:poly [ADP-ribose] polymerase